MKYFKKKQGFTEAGACDRENEDEFYMTKSYAFVIDGATGLTKANVTNEKDDVAWYAKTLKKHLITSLKQDKSLCEIVKDALSKTNADFKKFLTSVKLDIYPSACLTAIKIKNDMLEYYTIGDSQLLIKFKDGSIKLILDKSVEKLDEFAIDRMVEIAKEKNINVVEARQAINDILIGNRSLMNTDEGYYILSSDENAVKHGLFGQFPLKEIDCVLGCSDGFAEIYYLFKKYSFEKMFKLLKSDKTLLDFNNELKALQENDKGCNKFPRTKKRDDCSAFYVEL